MLGVGEMLGSSIMPRCTIYESLRKMGGPSLRSFGVRRFASQTIDMPTPDFVGVWAWHQSIE